MKKSGHQIQLLIALVTLLITGNLFAETLYNSTTLNSSGGSLNATSWPSLNDGLIMVDDITVPASGWTINNLSNYFGIIGSPVVDSAFFFVYSKSLENVYPMDYALKVPVIADTLTLTDPSNSQSRLAYKITASNLNVTLQAGDYWIGLSPIAGSYETNWMAWGSSEVHGELAMCYDMIQHNWVGLTFWTGPDYMMTIEGAVGTATYDTSLNKPIFNNLTNYPNPFNPNTTICFNLSKAGSVNLEIYNLKGQRIKSLINQTLGTGEHNAVWTGTDENGKKVSSGVYFYRLTAGSTSVMKKMIMVK